MIRSEACIAKPPQAEARSGLLSVCGELVYPSRINLGTSAVACVGMAAEAEGLLTRLSKNCQQKYRKYGVKCIKYSFFPNIEYAA